MQFLHARLVALKDTEQESLIRSLSPGTRLALKAHVQSVQSKLLDDERPAPSARPPAGCEVGSASGPSTGGLYIDQLRRLQTKKRFMESQAQRQATFAALAATSGPAPAPNPAPASASAVLVPAMAFATAAAGDLGEGSEEAPRPKRDFGEEYLRLLQQKKELLESLIAEQRPDSDDESNEDEGEAADADSFEYLDDDEALNDRSSGEDRPLSSLYLRTHAESDLEEETRDETERILNNARREALGLGPRYTRRYAAEGNEAERILDVARREVLGFGGLHSRGFAGENDDEAEIWAAMDSDLGDGLQADLDAALACQGRLEAWREHLDQKEAAQAAREAEAARVALSPSASVASAGSASGDSDSSNWSGADPDDLHRRLDRLLESQRSLEGSLRHLRTAMDDELKEDSDECSDKDLDSRECCEVPRRAFAAQEEAPSPPQIGPFGSRPRFTQRSRFSTRGRSRLGGLAPPTLDSPSPSGPSTPARSYSPASMEAPGRPEAGSMPSSPSARSRQPVLTPSRQQLIFRPARPRNTKPLGSLQPSSIIVPRPYPRSAVSPPSSPRFQQDIEPSGVDSDAVRDWLQGRVSGPLCLARLLDGLQHGRWSSERACKDLCATEKLYVGNQADCYGGTLGAMVGGVARALAQDTAILFGGAPAANRRPAVAVLEAGARLRDAAAMQPTTSADPLIGIGNLQINLAFRRRCIQNHPQREGGNLQSYCGAHLDHEVIRQWHSFPRIDSKDANEKLSDFELIAQLSKMEADVRADGKAAEDDESQRWHGKMSEHLLRLSEQKEVLEAELAELKNHGAYAALGVNPDASDAELARAYKMRALQSHPDRGGSNEAFQALQAAYESILESRPGAGKGPQKSKHGTATSTGPQKTPTDKPEAKAPSAANPPANCETTEEVGKAEMAEKVDTTIDADHEVQLISPKAHREVEEEPEPSPADASLAEVPEPNVPKVDVPKATSEKPFQNPDETATAKEEPSSTAERSDRETATSTVLSMDESLSQRLTPCGSPNAPDEKLTEDALRALIAGVPAEMISRQAELTVDGARVCQRVANLCKESCSVGIACWPQLRQLAMQCFDIASQVEDSARLVGRRAAQVPHDLVPVLDCVRRVSAKLKKPVAGQLVRGAKGLMKTTEAVADRGRDALLRATTLASSVAQMRLALADIGLSGNTSLRLCLGLADLVATVSRLTGNCAHAVGAAAVVVGDAQRTAQNFIDVLEAAGVWASADVPEERKDKTDEDPKEKKDDDASDDDSDDEDKEPSTPGSKRWQRHRLLVSLNAEVTGMQRELRGMVSKSPSLIEAVSGPQKVELFALAAELVEGARIAARRGASARLSPTASEADAVESALDFIFAASDWEKVAMPSLGARLLRLASLVDGRLLQTMLREELFDPLLAFARASARPQLEKRFNAAAEAIRLQGARGGGPRK